MINFPLPRLDKDEVLRNFLLKYCRIKPGGIWVDEKGKHKVGCFNCGDEKLVNRLMDGAKANLAVHDPPYNMVAFEFKNSGEFVKWCAGWVELSYKILEKDASFYVWLGADQKKNYEPFAEFIIMMKESGFTSKSFITMRNQRGYGTQKNWMSVRQELLYYVKGNPVFNVAGVYTDIPKVVKGYYKIVGGEKTENLERSKSDKIRAGNVWIDIQQVFHLMEENVNGCYAQKPLKAIDRIVKTSSSENDLIIDFFSHAGTTLLASEKNKRICYTVDIDPIYCEISIRRLENFRKTGKTGWQNSNPFADEILNDKEISAYLQNEYKLMDKL
ncbi:MAG: site-specific DNA-methyltransferase [Ignavibacteria bacterium]|nr:site-specific DNA-methyltransferase [Ignavibacteria bacterium]